MLTYVKSINNIVADALSQLSHLDEVNSTTCVPDTNLAEFFLNEQSYDALINPVDLVTIDKAQQTDKGLLRKLKAGMPNLQLKTFCGEAQVIWQDNLIYTPKTLQACVCHRMVSHYAMS